MSQTLINTLRFADRLKEAGFAGAQAEAFARVPSCSRPPMLRY